METSLLTDYDVYLFRSGTHYRLYEKMGSHPFPDGSGVQFALWAPNAQQVSVIGSFNDWQPKAHPMQARSDKSGIWEAFIPQAKRGDLYKYRLLDAEGLERTKSDPFAFFTETPPKSASIIWDTVHTWTDQAWLEKREIGDPLKRPMSIYEMHIGSWKRHTETFDSLSYQELATELVNYLKEMAFTHVELMPVMEHPFYGSWGYQVSQHFAPSSRYGLPQDLMSLIDALHQAEIGVILDWVPSHFPKDEFSLRKFDGTYLYEHADPRQGYHPDWDSLIYNYGRGEVKSFLISSALFWMDRYHADGLRVDAVASMLYLDYSRDEGFWIPNKYGGNENLEAIKLLQDLNTEVFRRFPNAHTIAEESTSWPMVSRPVYLGGLGFSQKWMMGWMHDTLEYFKNDPLYRKFRHHLLTFGITYVYSENFLLPLSHDEVVHGKASLLGKMPGTPWQKFANLRLLLGYLYTHPGTNLLFMGCELGQPHEWQHDAELPWTLLQKTEHAGIQALVKALNQLTRHEPALYEENFSQQGFAWIDLANFEQSVIAFQRRPSADTVASPLVVIFNFTPVPRPDYRLGVPLPGVWEEVLNSDEERFGGSGQVHQPATQTAVEGEFHTLPYSLTLQLPPLGFMVWKAQQVPDKATETKTKTKAKKAKKKNKPKK